MSIPGESCSYSIFKFNNVLNLMFSFSYAFMCAFRMLLDILGILWTALSNRFSISEIIALVNELTKLHNYCIEFNNLYSDDEELLSHLNKIVHHITTNKDGFVCIDPNNHSNKCHCHMIWLEVMNVLIISSYVICNNTLKRLMIRNYVIVKH